MDTEVIDISSLDDTMPGLSKGNTGNFGGGIELLMNEKKDESKSGDDGIKLNDLEELENELNEITGSSGNEPSISKSSIFTDPIPDLNDIDDVNESQLKLIKDFFAHYKANEAGKWVKVYNYENAEKTMEFIEEKMLKE